MSKSYRAIPTMARQSNKTRRTRVNDIRVNEIEQERREYVAESKENSGDVRS